MQNKGRKMWFISTSPQIPFLGWFSSGKTEAEISVLPESGNRWTWTFLLKLRNYDSVILSYSESYLAVQRLKTYMVVAQIVTISWKQIVTIMGYIQNILQLAQHRHWPNQNRRQMKTVSTAMIWLSVLVRLRCESKCSVAAWFDNGLCQFKPVQWSKWGEHRLCA